MAKLEILQADYKTLSRTVIRTSGARQFFRGTESEFPDANVAVRFSSGLVVIMLVIVLCRPEGRGGSQSGIYFMSLAA